MADEVEIKLDLAPDAADALECAGLLPGDPRIVPLHAIYFDTPDHGLSAADCSLRIRTAGGIRIQTVKAGSGGSVGLFARSEWEREVASDVPVLDGATPVAALLGDKVGDLAPVFEVRVERRIWDVGGPDAEIEVVLDRGEVRAADRRTPLCELELERKTGEPAALFALARRIAGAVPVRIGVISKAGRGYALSGPAPRAFKADRIALDADMTAAAAFRAIAGACLRQFRLNEPLLCAQDGVEPLHQARVALRRLRSAFAIHKPVLADPQSVRLREELRWFASLFGDARDLDVLLGRIAPGPLHDRLAAARADAYATLCATLDRERSRALLFDLVEWLAIGEWLAEPGAAAQRDRPVGAAAADMLDRFRRKVKKRGRGLAGLDDAARHEVRKDAKKLRYAAEFFAALYHGTKDRRRHKAFVAALADVQEQLGALNDLAAAPQLLDRLGLAGEPAVAALVDDDSRGRLLDDAAEAYDRFVAAKRFWH